MQKSTRIEFIDIAKFLGILFVVIGHLSSPVDTSVFPEEFANFFYQFHVPLFFFLSGIFFNYYDTWKVFLKKKVKRLYLTYLLANLCILAIHCLAHWIGGESVVAIDIIKHFIKIAVGLTYTDIAGPTWFLLALFEGAIIYKAIVWICQKFKCYWILIHSIVLAIVVFTSLLPLFPVFQRPLTAMIFIHLGKTLIAAE